jgi:hypothetical protein
MTVATRLHSAPRDLECQFIAGSCSVRMAFSPYRVRTIVRTPRGSIR